ncbi:DUF1847 domain-containing protein [Rhodoplanes serenus]|uniref:DUF1847 domain-containing protein n=1 Tax=Rhodoplanes serenus TaxID=200615 RepID=UPI000DACF0DB|nr:DUF1847 domain-containing protein [Rhodoplanes serenus]RAI34941.1 hypothetical protein CH340_07540 [Rhodoplanes serenus]
MTKPAEPTCSECGQLDCYHQRGNPPAFCVGKQTAPEVAEEVAERYRGDGPDAVLARASAEVEGTYYGKLNRVEETLAFARRIGAHRIGIATCVGLIEEARLFATILRRGGFDPQTVLCKIGGLDKTEIGVPDAHKIKPGGFEACCNPVLQAVALNAKKTDLNVLIGLCVGHDALFYKHSDAPVTTLITKDRVLGHNPAAALYTAKSYGKRVLDEDRLKDL